MSILGLFLTHSIAKEQRKPPYFFSRFNFERMKEEGHTHWCFDCIGSFKPDENGNVVLKRHDQQKHADAVVGNAEKFENVWDWLESELPKDFPYIVAIP